MRMPTPSCPHPSLQRQVPGLSVLMGPSPVGVHPSQIIPYTHTGVGLHQCETVGGGGAGCPICDVNPAPNHLARAKTLPKPLAGMSEVLEPLFSLRFANTKESANSGSFVRKDFTASPSSQGTAQVPSGRSQRLRRSSSQPSRPFQFQVALQSARQVGGLVCGPVSGHHHHTMWSIAGTPAAGMRVPPSLVNFPAEHEEDSAPVLAGWIPAKGLSVPITCLGPRCSSSSVPATHVTSALVHLASPMWELTLWLRSPESCHSAHGCLDL